MRRLGLVVLGAAAGLAAPLALGQWGCAMTVATGERGERPKDVFPDGGWDAYRPTPQRQPYAVDPSRAAIGEPSLSPAAPGVLP